MNFSRRLATPAALHAEPGLGLFSEILQAVRHIKKAAGQLRRRNPCRSAAGSRGRLPATLIILIPPGAKISTLAPPAGDQAQPPHDNQAQGGRFGGHTEVVIVQRRGASRRPYVETHNRIVTAPRTALGKGSVVRDIVRFIVDIKTLLSG